MWVHDAMSQHEQRAGDMFTVQQEQKTLLMFKYHVGKYKRKNVQTVEEILRYKKTREEMP